MAKNKNDNTTKHQDYMRNS